MKKLVLIAFLLPALAFAQNPPQPTKTNKKTNHPYLRLGLLQIFKVSNDNKLVALCNIKVGEIMLSEGDEIAPGRLINNIDFNALRGHDLLVDTLKGVVIYKGYYH